MHPWLTTTAACQALFLVAPLATILPGTSATGALPACSQDDVSRRRSSFSCEQLQEEGYCNKIGLLGDEALQTCQTSCGVGCRLPCEPDETNRRRSTYSCLEMFDNGFCGGDGNLVSEMAVTCRTTCYDALGCLPPCESDHTSRRRSGFSCQEMLNGGFCGADGNLGLETAVTCRTTCADTFGCSAQAPIDPAIDPALVEKWQYTADETLPSGVTSSDLMSSIVYKAAKATGLSGALSVPVSDITITGFTVNARRLSAAVRELSVTVSVTTSFTVQVADASIAEVLITTISGAADAIKTQTNNAMFAADWSGESVLTAAPTMTNVATPFMNAENDANEPDEDEDSDSLREASWEHAVGLPLGLVLVCCCGVCIFAVVCRPGSKKGQGEPLNESGAEAAIEREPTLQEAVQQAATTTEAAKLEPLEGTPAADTATSMDSVFVSVHEEEDADEPDPKQLKKKKKRVKKPARAVSFHAADQVETIDDGGGDDDDDGEEEHRPKCPKCQQDMCWSDYSGPPYDTKYGWGCMNRDTCHNWKENCGRYRWNCRQCSEDMCEACSGLQNPAPAKRGVLSMWQPGEKIVEDTEEDDDARPGADAPARSRSFGSIINPCMADAGPRRTDASGASLFGNNGEQAEQQEAAGKRRTFFASIFSRIEESEGQEEQQEAAGKRRSLFASVFSSKEDQEGAAARPRPSVLGAVLQGSKTAVETRGQEAEQHEPVVVGAVIVEEPDKSEQERRPSNGSASSSSGSSSGGQQKS